MIKIAEEKLNIHEYIENVYCLDNFSAFEVEIDGIVYKTAEHAFQAIKFKDTAPQICQQIIRAKSPFEAREIAQKNKVLRRKDWSEVKYEIMEKVLYEKAIQNSYVKEKLLATDNNQIVEDCGSDDDKDWGCGLDGTGQNNLGKIWMRIRSKLEKK